MEFSQKKVLTYTVAKFRNSNKRTFFCVQQGEGNYSYLIVGVFSRFEYIREYKEKSYQLIKEARIPLDISPKSQFKCAPKIIWNEKLKYLTYVNNQGYVYQLNWESIFIRNMFSLKKNEDSLVDCVILDDSQNIIYNSFFGESILVSREIKLRENQKQGDFTVYRLNQNERVAQMVKDDISGNILILFEGSDQIFSLNLSTKKFDENKKIKKPFNQRLCAITCFSLFNSFLVVADSLGDIHLWDCSKENPDLLVLKNVTNTPITSCITFNFNSWKLAGSCLSSDNHLYFWEYDSNDLQTSLLNNQNLGKSDGNMTFEELKNTRLTLSNNLEISDSNSVLITSIAFYRTDSDTFLIQRSNFSFEIKNQKDDFSGIIVVPEQIDLEKMFPDENDVFSVTNGCYLVISGIMYFYNYADPKYVQILDFQKKEEKFDPKRPIIRLKHHEGSSNTLWFIIGQKIGIRDTLWALVIINTKTREVLKFQSFASSSMLMFYGDLKKGSNPLVGKLNRSLRELEIVKVEGFQIEGINEEIWESLNSCGSVKMDFKVSVLDIFMVYVKNRAYFMFLSTQNKLYLNCDPSKTKESENKFTMFEFRKNDTIDYGITISRFEVIKSVEYHHISDKSGIGVIITSHKLIFFNHNFEILKKSKIYKLKNIKGLGFFGTSYIYEDDYGVYSDSPRFIQHKLIISKNSKCEKIINIFADRIFKCSVDPTGVVTVNQADFCFLDLVIEDYLFLSTYPSLTQDSQIQNRLKCLEVGICKTAEKLRSIKIQSDNFQSLLNYHQFYPILAKVIDDKKEESYLDRFLFCCKTGEFDKSIENIGLRLFSNFKKFEDFLLLDNQTDYFEDVNFKKIYQLLSILEDKNYEKKILQTLESFRAKDNILNNLKYDSQKIHEIVDFPKFRQREILFDQQPYYIKTLNDKLLGLIAVDNIESILGLVPVRQITDTLILQKARQQKKSDEDEEEENSDEGYGEDENEDKKLIFLWRFDGISENNIISDFCDLTSQNGIFVGNKNLVLEKFENDSENPMELEDKWGSSIPSQGFVSIEDGYLKMEQKVWCNKKKLTELCLEMWFFPENDKNILFSDSQDNLMIGLKKNRLFVMVKGKKIKISSKVSKIQKFKWNHLAFSYSQSDLTLKIYLQGTIIKEEKGQNLQIQTWKDKPIIFFTDFKGKITEIRFWNKIRTPLEIKDEMNVPLGIVSEKTNKFIVKIKEGGIFDANENLKQHNLGNLGAFEGFGGFGLGGSDEDDQKWDFGINNDEEEQELELTKQDDSGAQVQNSNINNKNLEEQEKESQERWGISVPTGDGIEEGEDTREWGNIIIKQNVVEEDKGDQNYKEIISSGELEWNIGQPVNDNQIQDEHIDNQIWEFNNQKSEMDDKLNDFSDFDGFNNDLKENIAIQQIMQEEQASEDFEQIHTINKQRSKVFGQYQFVLNKKVEDNSKKVNIEEGNIDDIILELPNYTERIANQARKLYLDDKLEESISLLNEALNEFHAMYVAITSQANEDCKNILNTQVQRIVVLKLFTSSFLEQSYNQDFHEVRLRMILLFDLNLEKFETSILCFTLSKQLKENNNYAALFGLLKEFVQKGKLNDGLTKQHSGFYKQLLTVYFRFYILGMCDKYVKFVQSKPENQL